MDNLVRNGIMTRRRAIATMAVALSAGGPAGIAFGKDGREGEKALPLLVGVDGWSFSFACGMRDVKPARRMTAWDILAKVRHWGLKGAQVEPGPTQMPKLGSAEFESFRTAIRKAGLYWEVSAGAVQREEQVLEALEYTCHLKDWNLIRSRDGLIVRSCALGDGVVDLKAIVRILRSNAPAGRPLHLNIESPQEYLPLRLFTAEFWRWHGDVTGSDLGNILRLAERRGMPAETDCRIASMRGEPETAILAEEEAAVVRSVAYCRDVLGLL